MENENTKSRIIPASLIAYIMTVPSPAEAKNRIILDTVKGGV